MAHHPDRARRFTTSWRSARPTGMAAEPHVPHLPQLLRGVYRVKQGEFAIADAAPGPVVKQRFPNTYPAHTVDFVANETFTAKGKQTNIGVVLAGGPAPGMVFLMTGLFTYLRKWNATSTLYAFRGGPQGLLDNDSFPITKELLVDMQKKSGLANMGTGRLKLNEETFPKVRETCEKLDLSGLLVVGGFDSNTDSAFLAEYLKTNGSKTNVVCIAKRSEGVRALGVDMGFGFDSVTKLYSQLIGNLMIDSASAKAHWHFARLMGERASNICLEVALQSHANVTVLGEEVEAKNWRLADIVNNLCDAICLRARKGKNYGVVCLPEGIMHSLGDLQGVISEINDRLVQGIPQETALQQLTEPNRTVWDALPEWVQMQLLGERDPHGHVRMAGIQIERFLADMCEVELRRRKADGKYVGKFTYVCHFYGYEARCCHPSPFDISLSHTLGHVVGALVESGHTGMLATVTNLTAPLDDWGARGIPLTSLMHIGRRGDPSVKRSVVQLDGYVFRALESMRQKWVTEDLVCAPVGPLSDDLNMTLLLEELESRHTSAGPELLQSTKDVEFVHMVRDVIIEHSTFRLKRLQYLPAIPQVLQGAFRLLPEPSADLPKELADLFPALSGLPSTVISHNTEGNLTIGKTLNIGVILSGGPAPGGHNVIVGLYDYLKNRNGRSKLLGFNDGPAGLVEGRCQEMSGDTIAAFRNQGGFHLIGTSRTKIETPEQFQRSKDTVERYHLDGLVVCGGDDSNTNAALLANYFKEEGVTCGVVGLPKTIDADLRNEDVEMSFGFDTTCKLYSQLIANIAADAAVSKTTYHFIRLMGRSASHISLECALQTHANYAIVSEEVDHKQQTMVEIVQEIADIICVRARAGKNYGIILIPEGLVEATRDMKLLISELNEVLAHDVPHSEIGAKLTEEARTMFALLPDWLRAQLLGERDPHGNVRVSAIESERMVAALVEAEVKNREEYAKKFTMRYWCHFLGYQGRCSLPSNFDCNYCYTLGHMAGALIEGGATGVIAAIRNLMAPVDHWVLRGLPLVSLMNMERRHGKSKPVIKKKLVELDSKVFLEFAERRQDWAAEDTFPNLERIKELDATSDELCYTLTKA